MKVMILNNSGNVGKSFLARELLYANMECEDKKIIEIETHNSANEKFNDINVISISGRDIKSLLQLLLQLDCAIVDVGASNIINFFEELGKNDMDMIFEEIDFFIVPVVPQTKQQEDTLKTLSAIKELGIPTEKVRIVFNATDNIADFDTFIEKAKQLGYTIDNNLTIKDYENLHKIELLGITANQLASSDKNYKALAKEAYKQGDTEKGNKYAELALLKGTAKAITKNLQDVFTAIRG